MEVYKSISAVMAAMAKEGIGKDRKNAQQGYAFRGIDDIYNALSRHLAANQLCIIPRIQTREVTERTSKSGTAQFYVTVFAEYDIVSAKDGSKHTAAAYGEAQDSGDKATNKAMSAAYKYMAMQLFCIPTEGDNDADATTAEATDGLKDARDATSAEIEKAKAAGMPAKDVADLRKEVSVAASADALRAIVRTCRAYVKPEPAA